MTMWPLAASVGGLWREVTYTVTQLLHSECGRICRGSLAGGPFKRVTTVQFPNIVISFIMLEYVLK